MLTVLPGCPANEGALRVQQPPPVVLGQQMSPLGPDAEARDLREYVVMVRLHLRTVQLPLGSVSDTEELWSHLNEEPLGIRLGTALGLNGIRIGLGTESAWADVAKVLRRLTGRDLSRGHVDARPDSAVPIVTRQGAGRQTIFTFRADRTLAGYDYPPGENVLMLMPAINYDNPTSVHVTGTPVVRSLLRRQGYVRQPEGFVHTFEPDHYPLEDLSFRLEVPPKGFLVIGPSSGIRRTTSPGHHFLARESQGLTFETILVIAPEVFAAPLRKAPLEARSGKVSGKR